MSLFDVSQYFRLSKTCCIHVLNLGHQKYMTLFVCDHNPPTLHWTDGRTDVMLVA